MLELLIKAALTAVGKGDFLVSAEPDGAGGLIIRVRPVPKGG